MGSTFADNTFRKRAKTEDEKEQRRVERVIRNRKAASASRERKRQEAEALALRNKELEAQLALLQERNSQLERELKMARPELGGVSSPANESVTFSQELFPSQPLSNMSQSSLDLLNDILNKSEQTPKTVDPTTISPALSPVAEEPEFDEAAIQQETVAEVSKPAVEKTTTQITTSNHPSTQYPAAVLWSDLQCQRPVEAALWVSTAVQSHFTTVLLMLQMASSLSTLVLNMNSWARTSSTPSSSRQPSTTTTSSRRPHLPTALISIILAVTNPPTSRPSSSTSTTSAAPPTTTATNQALAQPTLPSNSSYPKNTLRLRTLRKLLTCNRQLARPLQDATLEVLRLSLTKGTAAHAVLGQDNVAGELSILPPALLEQQQLLSIGAADGSRKWPSTERLISLLWAIRALERRIQLREQGVQDVKGAESSSKLSSSSESKMVRLRFIRRRSRGRPWDTSERN